MSAETKKILEMLVAGKISPQDAERLLDKLSSAAPAGEPSGAQAGGAAATGGTAPQRPRYVHIHVDRPGRDDVHVRVPISSMRGGAHWMAFLPVRVAEKLSEYGIDFGSLDAMNEEQFRRAMDRINVDIQQHNGKHVRIYAE
ncbi:MAG TPA: hypothetical protein VJN90_05505 [Candidatus Acidoferrales bacterium]|nr:hypothetical protein [Candidatus Acidoferrales bacterium]